MHFYMENVREDLLIEKKPKFVVLDFPRSQVSLFLVQVLVFL